MLTILVSLAAAGTALAMPNALPHPAYEVIQIRQIASTDLGSSVPTGCLPDPSALSLFMDIPTPPADLQSAIMTVTDYCHEPSFTGTVGQEYTSYQSVVLSWYSAHSAEISSFDSSFSKACSLASEVLTNTGLPVCTAITTGSSGSGSSSKTTGKGTSGGSSATSNASGSSGSAAATGSGTGTGSSQAASTAGAAPLQTALGYAAGLVAGLAGVVAAL